MAKGGGEQRPGSDETKYIAAAVLALAAGWLLWAQARGFVAVLAFGPDWIQMKVLDLLGLLDPLGQRWLSLQTDILGSIFGLVQDPARRINIYNLEWGKHFVASSEVTGGRMRWFVTALLGVLTALIVFRMRGEGFRRQFSLTGRTFTAVYRVFGWRGMSDVLKKMDKKRWWHPFAWVMFLLKKTRIVRSRKEWVRDSPDFAGYQSQYWKVALVGAMFDPDSGDPRTAQSMTPPEWLRHNKVSLTRKNGLDVEASGAAFARQLGAAWTGVKNAPYYVQAICVMAVLNHRWEVDKIMHLRNELAVAHVMNKGAAVEKAARALLAPYLNDAKLVRGIDRICGQHHYITTATMRIYGWGGPFTEWDGGQSAELAPAKFLWLKAVDRNLWYALQQIGRRAFMVEGAGSVSHFYYERIGGNRPISDPKVVKAMEGLQKYLDYHSIKDLEEFFYVEPDV